jgi:hypothetical protein
MGAVECKVGHNSSAHSGGYMFPICCFLSCRHFLAHFGIYSDADRKIVDPPLSDRALEILRKMEEDEKVKNK